MDSQQLNILLKERKNLTLEFRKIHSSIFLLTISLLILSSFVQAQIYDNYLENNQEITIAGINFKVSYGEEKKELILDSNLGAIIIPQGDSRTLENNIYKFVDINNKKYHLIVEKYEVSTYIERNIKTKTVFIGNPLEIEIIIKNRGNTPVSAVTFSQDIKTEIFKISDFYKLIKDNKEELNNITSKDFINWIGKLEPLEEIKLIYQITPIIAGKNNQLELQAAKISYEEAGLTLELFSEKDVINTKEVISPSIEFISAKFTNSNLKINANNENVITEEPDYIKIGTTAEYKVKLSNYYLTDIDVKDFELVIPKELTIVAKDKLFIRQNSTLFWDGIIKKDENKEFSLIIKGDKRYVADIKLSFKTLIKTSIQNLIQTSIEEIIINNNYTKQIIFDIAKLEPIITLNKEEYDGNDELIAKIIFINSDELLFFNFSANFTTDFYFKNISYVTIPNKKEILISEQTILIPSTDTKKIFEIKFSGSYTTAGNEMITFTKKKSFIVNPSEFDKIYKMEYLYHGLSNNSTEGIIFAKVDLLNVLKEITSLRITTKYKDKFNQEQKISSFFSAEETAKISEKRPAGQLINFGLTNLTNSSKDMFKHSTEIQYVNKDKYYYQDISETYSIEEFIKKIKQGEEMNYFDIGRFYIKEIAFQQLLKDESIKVYEEKTVSKKNTAVLVSAIIAILLAIIIVNYIIKKKSISRYKFTGNVLLKKDAVINIFKAPKPTFDYTVLQKYISFCKQNNIPKSKIRQNLIKESWLPQIIDEFLK